MVNITCGPQRAVDNLAKFATFAESHGWTPWNIGAGAKRRDFW